MALTPEQERSINEDLLSQVNAENVLAAAALFQKQADDLRARLHGASQELQVGRCGGDPVSADAQRMFQARIDQIIRVHWAHHEELTAAVAALRAAARSYGHTDADIARAFDASVDR